jgi:hypothetical protein
MQAASRSKKKETPLASQINVTGNVAIRGVT